MTNPLEPSIERPQRRLLPPRFGLSAKLLLLTIPLVMIAEVLIYVPSIANFRVNRLNDRLAAANNGDPFFIGNLTEDYEVGIRVKRAGYRAGSREILGGAFTHIDYAHMPMGQECRSPGNRHSTHPELRNRN